MPAMLVEDAVAKKSSKPAPAAPEPEPAKESGRKPMVLQMRGSEEWKSWIEGLAALDGFTVSTLVDQMARQRARDKGYPDPPKR